MTREVRVVRASLVVRLKDRWAPGDRVRGDVVVTAASPKARQVAQTPVGSGAYAFLDLPAETYGVDVAPEFDEVTRTYRFYFPERASFVVPRPVPADPVVEVELVPTPSYPFPAGATLLRGLIRKAGGPLAGATVEVDGKPVFGKTAGTGDFVLAFGPQQVDQAVTLKVTHPTLPAPPPPPQQFPANVRRGRSESVGVLNIP